jgi:hypothetical protein
MVQQSLLLEALMRQWQEAPPPQSPTLLQA